MRRGLSVVGLLIATSGAAFATADTGARELRGAIQQSAQSMRAMQATDDVDRDFVTAMQRRHQDSIELARVEVKHGKDPSVRALARELIDKQKRDLDDLERWLWLRRVAERSQSSTSTSTSASASEE